MSKSRNYWYGIVKKMVSRYPELANDTSSQAKQYKEAIDNAIKATVEMENGEDRMKAVEMVCFSKKYTVFGAADAVHYSSRTVQRWIIKFIKTVGKNVGF